MGVIRLPDELQQAIEEQVAEGRAASAAAFLEEAVRRLVDDARGEADDLAGVVDAGSADIEAGRFTTIGNAGDERRLHDGMMERLRARLLPGG